MKLLSLTAQCRWISQLDLLISHEKILREQNTGPINPDVINSGNISSWHWAKKKKNEVDITWKVLDNFGLVCEQWAGERGLWSAGKENALKLGFDKFTTWSRSWLQFGTLFGRFLNGCQKMKLFHLNLNLAMCWFAFYIVED